MHTLAELAHHFDGCLHGNAEQLIKGVASLSRAHSTDLTYFDNITMLQLLNTAHVRLIDDVVTGINGE